MCSPTAAGRHRQLVEIAVQSERPDAFLGHEDVNARSVPEAADEHPRFCTKEIGTRSTAMRTLLENSGRRRRRCVSLRRHSVRCRSYLHAVSVDREIGGTIRDGGNGFRVVGGTVRETVGKIREAGGGDANAARKFRSWTEPFRVRAPGFRTLSASIGTSAGQCVTLAADFGSSAEEFGRVSRQFRTLAGAMRTLPENSDRGRGHSVSVRRNSERCRIRSRHRRDNSGRWRRISGRRRNDSIPCHRRSPRRRRILLAVGPMRSPAQLHGPGAGRNYCHVAGLGQPATQGCAPKWTIGSHVILSSTE